MANEGHVALLKQGVGEWNAWRKQNQGVQPDLAGADLFEANLSGANLRAADLREAELSRADLSAADLYRADLGEARLLEAFLVFTNFSGANLRRANLAFANLSRADLSAADLSEVSLNETVFSNTSLTGAKGLHSCIHLGPSGVDHRTLMKSGRLPLAFLRGCGVPPELQDALPSIMAKVEYYTCFISYGEPNLEFARKLRQDLNAVGVSCWLYDKDSTVGERSWKEIGQQRREAEKVVAVCLAHALMRDGFLKEIEEQIDEDPDKLVPISLDDLWKQPGFRMIRGARDLKPFMLDRNYADFANLSYEDALERLLKGLRRKEADTGDHKG